MDSRSYKWAFSKKRVDDRKKWLSAYQPGTYMDMHGEDVRYDDFINKELILFSRADLLRSIPSMVDGFKPSQRKASAAQLLQPPPHQLGMTVIKLLLWILHILGVSSGT